MYCKANDKGESGLADPICYRVRYSSYAQEKPNYIEKNNYSDEVKNNPADAVKSTLQISDENSSKNQDNKKSKSKR